MSAKLIFVYNASSGTLNNWMDIAHKIMSPKTYECDLCALTHGSFREKRIWKTFKEVAGVPMEFYHRDEFEKRFASKWLPPYEYPVILKVDGMQLDLLKSAQEIKSMETVEVLITSLKDVIANQDLS